MMFPRNLVLAFGAGVTAAKFPGQDAICSALTSSITDADQQLCPAVVQRSSDVTVEECAATVALVIGKVEQLFACPGSGSIVPNKTEACDFIAREEAYETAIVGGICENVGKFSTLLSSSCTRVVQSAWDSVEASCGSHLSESSTGVICDSFESSITDIDQRICPTVVQAGANVTLEECEDALHQVVGKAQQLFACPVSDKTVPDRTEVCNFFSKADANKTAIVGDLCGKFGTFLSGSCTRTVQGAWDSVEAAACGSHLSVKHGEPSSIICDAFESSTADIHQRICPIIVQNSENITQDQCEDGLNTIIAHAERIFNCIGGDAPMPDKTTACAFMKHGQANKTAIVTDTCGSMGSFMSATCVQLLQTAWDEFQAACGSHLSAGYATNVVV